MKRSKFSDSQILAAGAESKILKDFYQTGRLFRSSERPAPSQEALMIRRRHLRPHKRQVH